MFHVCLKLISSRIGSLAAFSCALILVMLAPSISRGQRPRGSADNGEPENKPAFSEFRGVRIGMAADEARKKLGNPKEKSPEQDFYVFNDNEAVQVFYDKGGTVSAVSVDFMSGSTGAPTAKQVLGADPETRADGSVYKLIRYPKAGYWVSYSRTAGTDSTTTVTMQKIP